MLFSLQYFSTASTKWLKNQSSKISQITQAFDFTSILLEEITWGCSSALEDSGHDKTKAAANVSRLHILPLT